MTSDQKLLKTSSRYICQEARKKISASSDQNWQVAEGCNVTMINSSKSELKGLIIKASFVNENTYLSKIMKEFKFHIDLSICSANGMIVCTYV